MTKEPAASAAGSRHMGRSYYFGNSIGLQKPPIAKGINAMFCGCPAKGKQNGIKLNVIIELPK